MNLHTINSDFSCRYNSVAHNKVSLSICFVVYSISVLSIWGYVDLRLTLNEFDDISKKSMTENGIQDGFQLNKVKFSKINFVSSKYTEMNCFKAAKNLIISNTVLGLDDEGLEDLKISEKIAIEATRCQNAKDTIFEINDTLMLLVVLAACAINMIFQSGLAVCHGK